ncbi:ABC-2 transporter permease [Oceanobacillus limi]|uniref:ABC-2 transporter permease n=1 Tax=Oceanobacillus limi TaxID=930131 RepID=UPI00147F762C|nr:ABC-2 transporter permease [Oceanobacillus limi]
MKLTKFYIIFFFILIPVSYGLNFPIRTTFVWIILGFIIFSFFCDDKNEVNRFLTSLPVKRRQIVFARYIYFLILSAGFSGYIGTIDYFAYQGLPFLERNPISFFGAFELFTITSLLLAVSIPIFYYFRNFNKAITAYFILLFIGAFSFGVAQGNPYLTFDDQLKQKIHQLIDVQPYLILTVLSLGSLFISYLLSTWLFTKRDI